MCSTRLPAVFGEMARRAPIWRFDSPLGDESQYLDLAPGQIGRTVAPAVGTVPGGPEHGVDDGAIHPPGALVAVVTRPPRRRP